MDTSCCASPKALLAGSFAVSGGGGTPAGTVSEVPCHHAYKLLSTFASTQLSWVNAQLGLSVLHGGGGAADDGVREADDGGGNADNGTSAVGMIV